MDTDYLSHERSFIPKYYKKVGLPPNTRYFYSAKDYRNWVNKIADEKVKQAKKKEAAAATFNATRKLEQEREKAIAKTREEAARKKQEEEARLQREKEAKRMELAKREEAAENAEAEARRKVAETNQRRKLPEEVSLKDYLFGGQFKKDLKISSNNLKKIRKELQRQQKEAARLDAQIKRMSDKADHLSGRGKQKLERLQKQRAELQASIEQSRKQNAKYIEDYSVALYRYQGATLIGSVGKKMKSGKRKASRIIEKYSKKLVSSLPSVKLKRDKS